MVLQSTHIGQFNTTHIKFPSFTVNSSTNTVLYNNRRQKPSPFYHKLLSPTSTSTSTSTISSLVYSCVYFYSANTCWMYQTIPSHKTSKLAETRLTCLYMVLSYNVPNIMYILYNRGSRPSLQSALYISSNLSSY